jgi:hypothetical protein
MDSRTYVVGLPVSVTVREDGLVTWEVAVDETVDGMRDSWGEYTSDEHDADTAAVEAVLGTMTEPWSHVTPEMTYSPVQGWIALPKETA